MVPGDLSGVGTAVLGAIMPSVNDLISRDSGEAPKANPMYSRKTQAPMVWIHLRKALPIAVDREFYNISAIPDTLKDRSGGKKESEKSSDKAKIVNVQRDIPMSFFQSRKVDPVMIKNGLYLGMPLRQPPQETVNVAAVEDMRTIQGVADYERKKREISRLERGVTDWIKTLVSAP